MFLLLAAGLCLAAMPLFARTTRGAPALSVSGFDGISVILGFALTMVAAMVFGPLNGLALIAAMTLHQAGHILCAGQMGIPGRELRLRPSLGDASHSARALPDDLSRFYHAIMGPALSLPVMVLAFALSERLAGSAPDLAFFLWSLGVSVGFVNVLALMPFQKLDGGTCLTTLARAAPPKTYHLILAGAIAGLTLVGILAASPIPYAFALAAIFGLSLRTDAHSRRERMPTGAALVALPAYLCTLAAHGAGLAMFFYGPF